MERAFYREAAFNHQANQIESALTHLALPARVAGGVIREDRVRYHLTPAVGAQPLEFIQLAEDVANAIGVEELRVVREAGELAIEVPLKRASDLRLLPLLRTLPRLQPLSALAGMSLDGKPLVLDLARQRTWHVLIQAPAGSGKSELLRTLLLSLGLFSRPAQVGFLGIDPGGRELAPLEALPHALTDLASDAGFAEDLLLWLAEEIDRRRLTGVRSPHMMLFIDGLDELQARFGTALHEMLSPILARGQEAGVHLIASARLTDLNQGDARGVMRVDWREEQEGRAGRFCFRSGLEAVLADVAWMGARELDEAVRMVQSGWRTG
jgi:S-DNA-T family DNA segregation ATPase FtsK/SpoIIIE